MKKWWIAFLLLIISCSFLHQSLAKAADSVDINQQTPQPCSQLIDQLFADSSWKEDLINPEIKTEEDLSVQMERYTEIHACIEVTPGEISEDLNLVYTLTEYFMIFAGGYETAPSETSLLLVDLQESTDPAIQQIRDQAEIAPPKGYVYVRFYKSRRSMPPLVERVFENENIAGVTMLARYIAILEEDQVLWEEQALQSQSLPKTLSHELVHAYLKSITGSASFEAFPTWYDEGLAIYFSGSGEDTSIVTPNGQIVLTPTEDYKHYQMIFDYLEAELGREKILKLIKHSIEAVDPAILFRGAGFFNDIQLIERAQAWKNKQDGFRIGVVSLMILLVGLGLFRLTPETKCRYCGFGGRRKDFAEGYCPECKRLLN